MMKILVLLLCSSVFAVPLGEQEDALAELLRKVLEADPLENDIGINEISKKDTSTPINNVLENKNDVTANKTGLPGNTVDSTSKTADESNKEKPETAIGEFILDPTPEEYITENQPVTETESDLDTKAITGTLIIDTITEDDKSNSKSDGLDKQTQIDEPKEEPSSYDELGTPERISINPDSLYADWKPSLSRLRPFNKDYDDHFTKLEIPFLSPLDTLPMDQSFFESTTNTDYDAPPQDYPLYDNTYDDDQTTVMANDSNTDYPSYDNYDDDQATELTANDSNTESNDLIEQNTLESIPVENDGIQDPIDDTTVYENDQTYAEDPSVLSMNENPDSDISEPQNIDINQPPAYNTDIISDSETDSTVPFYPNRFADNMKGDFDYTDDQTPNYPLDNNPNFDRTSLNYPMDNQNFDRNSPNSPNYPLDNNPNFDRNSPNYPLDNNPNYDRNYHSYNLGDNMQNEQDFIRFNARGPFHPHYYYDSYDKYINIGDMKHFNPYMFYPKRYDGYDLFFRPPYQRENRDKMMEITPADVMEAQRNEEINYEDNSNSNTEERLPEDNIETNMDKTNIYDLNNNAYVDNENAETGNDPKDISISEQVAPQDTYNQVYGNRPEWNLPHPVLNSDFIPMTDASSPVQSQNAIIEVPQYYDNGYNYYGDKFINNKRDASMYLFNGLVRNLRDDSRFRKFYQYKNNPYNRDDGPIIVFVSPPRYQDNGETLDTNQVNGEIENQFINSEGTLLTDINHNVNIPYAPGYHPAFYTDNYLYANGDNNIDEDRHFAHKQSYNQVDMPANNQLYNDMIASYPSHDDDFEHQRNYYKRNLYNNQNNRYSDYYGDVFKPNRYYRREPRDFMNDYRYF